MPSRVVALVCSLAAGPALAAPPKDPHAAILDEINAGDPTITNPPAPLERLLAAAELAEARLKVAVEPDDVADLLGLTAIARRAAYQRTGAASHLCELLASASGVLEREELTTSVEAAAQALRDEMRVALAAHEGAPCVQAVSTGHDDPPAVAEAVAGPPPAPAGASRRPTFDPKEERRVWVFGLGVGLVGGGVVSLALGLGMGGYDLQRYGQQLDARFADIQERGGRTPGDDWFLDHLDRRLDGARNLMILSGVIAAVFVPVGAGLLSWSLKGRAAESSARARLKPYGGPQGVGLSIAGRF